MSSSDPSNLGKILVLFAVIIAIIGFLLITLGKLPFFKYQIDKGIQCYVLPTQMRSTTPLYRLVNGKPDHFYTISSTEKDNAVKSYGYTYEGVAGYIFATNQS